MLPHLLPIRCYLWSLLCLALLAGCRSERVAFRFQVASTPVAGWSERPDSLAGSAAATAASGKQPVEPIELAGQPAAALLVTTPRTTPARPICRFAPRPQSTREPGRTGRGPSRRRTGLPSFTPAARPAWDESDTGTLLLLAGVSLLLFLAIKFPVVLWVLLGLVTLVLGFAIYFSFFYLGHNGHKLGG